MSCRQPVKNRRQTAVSRRQETKLDLDPAFRPAEKNVFLPSAVCRLPSVFQTSNINNVPGFFQRFHKLVASLYLNFGNRFASNHQEETIACCQRKFGALNTG